MGFPATSLDPKHHPHLRLATIVWAIILFLIAVYSIQHGGKGHVVETGLSIASVAYGCLLGVFLLGTLTKYATQTGTIIGMLCGFILNLTLWLPTITPIRHLGPILIPKVAFTWYVLLGALVTFLIGSIASLILPKPRRTVAAVLLLILLAFAFLRCCHSRREARRHYFSSGTHSPPSLTDNRQQTTDNRFLRDFSPISTLIQAAILQPKNSPEPS